MTNMVAYNTWPNLQLHETLKCQTFKHNWMSGGQTAEEQYNYEA